MILTTLVRMQIVLCALLVQVMLWCVQPVKLDMDYLMIVVLHHASVSADVNEKLYADMYVKPETF